MMGWLRNLKHASWGSNVNLLRLPTLQPSTLLVSAPESAKSPWHPKLAACGSMTRHVAVQRHVAALWVLLMSSCL
jgi:hypothetical protein